MSYILSIGIFVILISSRLITVPHIYALFLCDITVVCRLPQEIFSIATLLSPVTNYGAHYVFVVRPPKAPKSPRPHVNTSPASVNAAACPHPHDI